MLFSLPFSGGVAEARNACLTRASYVRIHSRVYLKNRTNATNELCFAPFLGSSRSELQALLKFDSLAIICASFSSCSHTYCGSYATLIPLANPCVMLVVLAKRLDLASMRAFPNDIRNVHEPKVPCY
jgi:hypothetical protein